MESDPRSISWNTRACQIVAIAQSVAQFNCSSPRSGVLSPAGFVAYINQVVDSVAKIVSEQMIC